jgi:rhamnulokinase
LDAAYLAIDIGASSGRHILGHIEGGRLEIQEAYRFENGMQMKGNTRVWDVERLFSHIKEGMKRCREMGKIPSYVGIDTWGVDFVLLDRDDRLIGDAVAYRDRRTQDMAAELDKIISQEALYRITGLQNSPFNTSHQLLALKKQHPQQLERAKTFLMLPDYFNFLLTGIKAAEYSDCSTTQLLNAKTGDWDFGLIARMGLPEKIFLPISEPGTPLGPLLPEVAAEVGFEATVVQPPEHDTASGVMGVPARGKDFIYISSGTWSLMGAELKGPVLTETARRYNLTNEGGYGKTIRFLKNIMGMWMIQEVRREMNGRYTYDEYCALAEESGNFPSVVDVVDPRYMAPDSMIRAIQDECRRTGQRVPETPGELAQVIYRSLAQSYKNTLAQIEEATGKTYDTIHIVGGGSNADYLNRLAAKMTGRRVVAGPSEATAIGNLACQMITSGELESLAHARQVIAGSFSVKTYEP